MGQVWLAKRANSVSRRGSSVGVLGLNALIAEMADQGVAQDALLLGTGIEPQILGAPSLVLSPDQKIQLFSNAKRLARDSSFALRAGKRQRISDFGIYGYAMASSDTVGDAVALLFRHLPLAGPMLDIKLSVTKDEGILRGSAPDTLGELLPTAVEFWRASMHTLFSAIIERPFPNTQMRLPYAAPKHWREYEALFGCPVHFEQDELAWQFDLSIMDAPCPARNPATAEICRNLCEQIVEVATELPSLSQQVRARCFDQLPPFPTAAQMADELGISLRSLHRRLATEGETYKGVVDGVRQTLATEFLVNTTVNVEEIAERVGYSDAANFRKAFKRWTGLTPAEYCNHQLIEP